VEVSEGDTRARESLEVDQVLVNILSSEESKSDLAAKGRVRSRSCVS